ncbi:LysR family transcriptional regulator [Ottowia sp. VDI28]|uniref:LysR family transcriptional regulator n=1 Tax=Ottowia sp. VDI28 TaxID=3133968 RepID=UPI003C2EC9AA
MNLQQLTHFVALAETRSFSRASESVHITQSALSRSIQLLEQELGLPLVSRIGKSNELTPFGTQVLARVRHIVQEAGELKRAATLLAYGATGPINLGMGSAPGALFAAPLMTHLLRAHPKIQLRLLGGSPDLQISQLRARQTDGLLITYRALPPAEDLQVDVLPALRSGFICRAGHPLAQSSKLRFEDLRAYPLVCTQASDDAARTLLERYGEQAHLKPWIQAASEDVGALLRTVAATDAVFLGVVAAASAQISEGSLHELLLTPSAKLQAQFAFVTLKGRAESPALQVVRQFCQELAHEALDSKG